MVYIDMCNSQTLDSISLSGNGESLHSSLLAVDCCTPGKGISKSATVKIPFNLTGQKFGRLSVFKFSRNNPKVGNYWLCRCDCGVVIERTTSKLKDKQNPNCSCGCARKDSIAKASAAAWLVTTKFRHNDKRRLKSMRHNMIVRCHHAGSRSFQNYGARGISVCEEWLSDPQSFYQWAIKNGYKRELTLERKNFNLGYSPDNCCFATLLEQANNTRRNRFLTFNGKTQTLAQWGRELGIKSGRIWSRLERDKWTVEKALSTPFRK